MHTLACRTAMSSNLNKPICQQRTHQHQETTRWRSQSEEWRSHRPMRAYLFLLQRGVCGMRAAMNRCTLFFAHVVFETSRRHPHHCWCMMLLVLHDALWFAAWRPPIKMRNAWLCRLLFRVDLCSINDVTQKTKSLVIVQRCAQGRG